MFKSVKALAPRVSVRAKGTYVAPGGRTTVPRRATTKLRSEDVRPAIYYKFDQTVQLSDGSTIKRKSVFPRKEWKMLSDQRNNSLWNPSKPDIKAIQLDASGKLAKFRRKFGELDSDPSDPSSDSTQDGSSSFSLDDIMSQDAEQVTTGRLHQVNQKKKKK